MVVCIAYGLSVFAAVRLHGRTFVYGACLCLCLCGCVFVYVGVSVSLCIYAAVCFYIFACSCL